MSSSIERISTGIPEVDRIMGGGIPKGFLCIYVTTEESRESVIRQAAQFGIDFKKAIEDKRLIMVSFGHAVSTGDRYSKSRLRSPK